MHERWQSAWQRPAILLPKLLTGPTSSKIPTDTPSNSISDRLHPPINRHQRLPSVIPIVIRRSPPRRATEDEVENPDHHRAGGERNMAINRRTFVQASAALIGTIRGLGADETSAQNTQVLRKGMYSDPFIDIDQWRDAPIRYRYVHGGL